MRTRDHLWIFIMEQRDILKINRQLLLLTRQLANDGDAAELMTGVPKSVIDKIATLDMEEIEELAETVGVSLYTLRFTDPAFTRLLQMPRDARSTYAEAALVSNTRGGATFP
jgi:flagellar transcriptional activator FlhD